MTSKEERPKVAAFRLNPVLKKHGMSKRKLARLSGIPHAMLCRLARKGSNPTWVTLRRIVETLGCSMDEFAQKGGR